MRWLRCHLFKEAFDLKPMSGSRDKMRLQTFFGLRRQSKATTALFPHALTPEGEKHGAFVQVLPVQNG